jgi:ubiquinone/menaquinone biosynthesis C-methylase UbiE
MFYGPPKTDILIEFNRLARVLAKTGRIQTPEKYSRYFPAFLSFAYHIQAYRIALDFCRGKRVLDIGCFSGYGENLLSSSADEVVACDNDMEALTSAKRNYEAGNVRFLAASAGELPFPDKSFEVVIAFQILEHLPPDRVPAFLREIKRVIRKGGLLLLTTPNRTFRLLPFQRPFNREHYREYSLKQLRQTLDEVYPGSRIRGIRAQKWIEELEKERVRQSPFQVYLYSPLLGIVRKMLPSGIRSRIREVLNSRRVRKETERLPDWSDQFDDCYRLFSMEDFYQTEKDAPRAAEFFAVCEKQY